MGPATDISPYKGLLKITEDVLQSLENGEDKNLVFLLNKRQNVFKDIQRGGVGHMPRDTASWIRRIRECEDRCTCLAKTKKDGILNELQTIRNKERLKNTYGNRP